VARISAARSSEYLFLVAAGLAALAAVFMLTVWAPLQLRAFTLATTATRPVSSVNVDEFRAQAALSAN
jgi:hypothetical protein